MKTLVSVTDFLIYYAVDSAAGSSSPFHTQDPAGILKSRKLKMLLVKNVAAGSSSPYHIGDPAEFMKLVDDPAGYSSLYHARDPEIYEAG